MYGRKRYGWDRIRRVYRVLWLRLARYSPYHFFFLDTRKAISLQLRPYDWFLANPMWSWMIHNILDMIITHTDWYSRLSLSQPYISCLTDDWIKSEWTETHRVQIACVSALLLGEKHLTYIRLILAIKTLLLYYAPKVFAVCYCKMA